MKDGLRFVDSDMHIMEPPDLFDRYLDPAFKHRVSVPVGADGRPSRGPAAGLIVVDGQQISDADLQQYRKRTRRGPSQSTQPLSGSRLYDTGRLDFAVERDYNPEAQVNFPHVAENLPKNVPRAIAAQILMGGADLYGFTEADFKKADTAAEAGKVGANSKR